MEAEDQEIVTLESRYVEYLPNKDKSNCTIIITRNYEAVEYIYVSLWRQHGFRRIKIRVLLDRNQGSNIFTDRDLPNAVVINKFWKEQMLIVVGRLKKINWEKLVTLNIIHKTYCFHDSLLVMKMIGPHLIKTSISTTSELIILPNTII